MLGSRDDYLNSKLRTLAARASSVARLRWGKAITKLETGWIYIHEKRIDQLCAEVWCRRGK